MLDHTLSIVTSQLALELVEVVDGFLADGVALALVDVVCGFLIARLGGGGGWLLG